MKKKPNTNKPKVSVIIPSYNHENYVVRAIQSVLAQTLNKFELIIIDDGSTDSSAQRIKQIKDKRIKFFAQENQGAAETINKGIELSKGEYISILNSDDLYYPDRLMKMSSFLDVNPDKVLVSSLIQPINTTNEKVTEGPEYNEWLEWYDTALKNRAEYDSAYISLVKYNFIVSTSNIFIRSSIFEHEEKFSTLLKYCHDYELLLRISSKYAVAILEEKLLKYRLHQNNTIGEHPFLRHLEILYALFKTGDWERMLAAKSIKKREISALYRGLSKNPEINFSGWIGKYREDFETAQKSASLNEQALQKANVLIESFRSEIREANGHLQKLDAEVIKKNAKLEWVDGYLKKLHGLLSEKDVRLAKANHEIKALTAIISNKDQELNSVISNKDQELNSLKQKIENLNTQLETKELLLKEIFFSKGWLWLTRFRKIKLKLKSGKALSPEIVEQKTDDKTYAVKILHPVKSGRPKIIHVIANFMTGGSSRLIVDLIEYLGHKYDQEIVTFFIPRIPAYAGVKINDFSGHKKAKDFLAFFKRKKPAIVHVHYWGEGDANWYKEAFSAAADYRCSVIENVNTPVAPFIDDGVCKYVYVSEYAMHYTSPVVDKSLVIYPGSDLAMFSRKGTPMPDDTIGMVYRLELDKLKEDSIQVLIDVVKRRPRTKVFVIGGGTLLDIYKIQLAEQGVSANFELPGFVPYDRLPDYYRKFSLFVAPVWKESFGQVSPFAMGMEIPVTGYNVGALSEILGGNEHLGTNKEELCNIIINLLNAREKRRSVGISNRIRALEHYSVNTMIHKYDRLYGELLRQGNR